MRHDEPDHDLPKPDRPGAKPDQELPKPGRPPTGEQLPAEPTQPYPALRWHQETGQEVTVHSEAEDKALGPEYADHPPPAPGTKPAPKPTPPEPPRRGRE